MKTTSLFTLRLLYIFMFMVLVIALPASKPGGLLLLFTGVIAFVHIYYADRRNMKIHWSRVNRPFAVVDWGSEGKRFMLSERHKGFYISCAGAEVSKTAAYVKSCFEQSDNAAYKNSELPVLVFYFKWGEHILEEPPAYLARVTRDMDAALVAWHTALSANPAAYLQAYIEI